jgi:MFS family permease
MTQEVQMPDVDVTDASIGELVQRLSQQTATLVREEMHLAQAELKEKGKRAGIGAGLFGAAGVVALAALGALVAALILAIGELVAMWISAFIVTGALAVVAGLMALMGKKEVAEATPPKPEAAIESVQADVAEIKEKARR